MLLGLARVVSRWTLTTPWVSAGVLALLLAAPCTAGDDRASMMHPPELAPTAARNFTAFSRHPWTAGQLLAVADDPGRNETMLHMLQLQALHVHGSSDRPTSYVNDSAMMFRVWHAANVWLGAPDYTEDPDRKAAHKAIKPLNADRVLFRAARVDEWLVLMVTVFVLALLDYFVLRKWGTSVRNNLCITAFWICVGLSYNVYFWMRYGGEQALDWCTGFFLEWMLSVDNLFVFHMIFTFYKTPTDLMHKALYFGIVGAVGFRVIIFVAIGSLLQMMVWIRIIFGVLLIYSGVQVATEQEDEDEDISNTMLVRVLRWIFGSRLKDSYGLEEKDGCGRQQGHLFVRDENGRVCATMTVFVILCLEISDLVFAVDSVSAKVAQIDNQYVAYSSSVMAMFGLRAMFFVVESLVGYFEFLKYGICTILVMVGLELVISRFVKLESAIISIAILSVFTVSIMASMAKMALGKTGNSPPKSPVKGRDVGVETASSG